MSDYVDFHDKPFEELTRDEIEQLKREEAEEAPSTAQSDGAWKFNQTFTGVRIRYGSTEEYLKSVTERTNMLAEDYLDKRKEAMHYIASQTMFDFDKPVDNFVLDIVKQMGISSAKTRKRSAAESLARIVYPVARRMIPKKLIDAYEIYPDTVIRMEGIHLFDSYVGVEGRLKCYNAWIELDLPAYLTSKDIHDELELMSKASDMFALRLKLAIRDAHRASAAYRKKSFKIMLKMADIKKMTYGGFANTYPVTFHGVCKYIEKLGLNAVVEENASNRGTMAKGLTGVIPTNTQANDIKEIQV